MLFVPKKSQNLKSNNASHEALHIQSFNLTKKTKQWKTKKTQRK